MCKALDQGLKSEGHWKILEFLRCWNPDAMYPISRSETKITPKVNGRNNVTVTVHFLKLTWLAGTSTIWRCISHWKWGFSNVILVFGRGHMQRGQEIPLVKSPKKRIVVETFWVRSQYQDDTSSLPQKTKRYRCKPSKPNYWDKLPINWCRISSTNSTVGQQKPCTSFKEYANSWGHSLTTVLSHAKSDWPDFVHQQLLQIQVIPQMEDVFFLTFAKGCSTIILMIYKLLGLGAHKMQPPHFTKWIKQHGD